MIHPTAIIHPQAKLDATVQVGPFAVIDAGVELGADCVVGPHVYLTGETRIGAGNQFHAGCVIGDAPQDLKYKDEPTRLRIGDNNVFREHVTVHRSTKPDAETVIGSHNFFMANSHVGAQLCRWRPCDSGQRRAAGRARGGAGPRVYFRQLPRASVHRVGTLALMQGGAAISKDLPPFTIAQRENEICGLNVIGLRRAGLMAEQRLELKRLYHLLFRGGTNLRAALAEAQKEFTSAPAKVLLEFLAGAKHGVCADSGCGPAEKDE